MTTGEKIKHLRKKHGLTQTELGSKLGVKKNAVSKWECGRVDDIPASKIKAMSTIFGVPTSYLVDEDEQLPFSRSNFLFAPCEVIPDNIMPMPEMKLIPLIGTIACGEPITAEENIAERIPVPANIDADFSLRCKGDSMINARIFDGDIVFIKTMPLVENGEIAAVLIDGEATLKKVYYFPDENRLVLRPCNPMYSDMIYTDEELDEIRILGRAIVFQSYVKG